MRSWLASLLAGLLLAACTPEARVVDPPGGGSGGSTAGKASDTAGTKPAEDGGSPGAAGEPNGSAGQSGAGECLTPTSPRPGCAACMATTCASEIAACRDTACACGDFGETLGEINCLLACPDIEPEMTALTSCAQGCGFSGLMQAHRTTVDLWECLVVPPMGPPSCPECFNAP